MTSALLLAVFCSKLVGEPVAMLLVSGSDALAPSSFLLLVVRPGAPLVEFLLLVAMPFVTSSFFATDVGLFAVWLFSSQEDQNSHRHPGVLLRSHRGLITVNHSGQP